VPTSGTHITIVQRLAAEQQFQPLLGNPDPTLPEDDPAAVKMRYACLGACGPDIFYALADYGSELQDLESFLVKVGGTVDCVGELLGKVRRWVSGLESEITLGVVDSLKETSQLLHGVISEGFLALLAGHPVGLGVNLWPVFEPARQRDDPRGKWYWADYLHYVRTGRFVRNLLDNSDGNDNLRAYAFGYLTHYVTDVVGHPYVNQVVQAPWRLYWQRHHLVENFIDAYVWARWHDPLPPPRQPSTEEQPLDRILDPVNRNPMPTANTTTAQGAPFTFARLNDWINVGSASLGDPVDAIVEGVCEKIEEGLFDIGIAEELEPEAPTDADFLAWTKLMADTIRQTYDEAADSRPMNLANGFLVGGQLISRPDGYPTAEDVAGAYGVFRIVMRVATEEKILPPTPPDIAGDLDALANQFLSDLATDLGTIPAPPVPAPGTSPDFSVESLLQSLLNALDWAAQVVEAVAKAVFDYLVDYITAVGTLVADGVKYALYLLDCAIFALYRALRDVLVLQAYSAPYTEEIATVSGALNMSTLWRSMGDLPAGSYPPEEIAAERTRIGSTYSPAVPPTAPTEQPAVLLTAPYRPVTGGRGGPIPTRPDDFIDAPLGRNDMFRETGPEPPTGRRPRRTFRADRRNFGGALANSARGIELALAGFPRGTGLPDYNLDGDRGYAWPAWDVDPRPDGTNPPGDPLSPTDPANPAGVATVNAVPITG
jgi:zinc dependent phospholipase C